MGDTTGSAAAAAALLIFGFFLFVVAIATYVIGSFFLMKVFEKAGVEGKWRAFDGALPAALDHRAGRAGYEYPNPAQQMDLEVA